MIHVKNGLASHLPTLPVPSWIRHHLTHGPVEQISAMTVGTHQLTRTTVNQPSPSCVTITPHQTHMNGALLKGTVRFPSASRVSIKVE